MALILFLILLTGGLVYYITSPYFCAALSHYLSKKSGREISLDGLHITQERQPHITITGIKIGNAPWAKDPLLFSADRIEFSIKLWPLLKGQVVMPELILETPHLALETNSEKQDNWDFSGGTDTAPSKRSNVPIISHLQITKGSMHYVDAIHHMDSNLAISTAIASSQNTLYIEGHGTYITAPFTLTMSGGSLTTLQNSHQSYPFDMDFTAAMTHVQMHGVVDDPSTFKSFHIATSITGRNAADIFKITGIALPPTPPYRVKGDLIKQDDHWDFNHFIGIVGNSDLRGNVSWYPEQKPPYFKGNFDSESLDFKDLKGFIGADKKPDDPNRVIPDEPINVSRLTAMDADVVFSSKHIKTPDLIDNFSMTVFLRNGVLLLKPLSFAIADGKISSDIMIDARKTPPLVTTDTLFTRLSLQRLFAPLAAKFGKENVSAGLFGGRANIRGNGASLHDMLATSNGTVGMGMEGGELSKLLLELSGLDLFKSAGLVVTGDKPVPINCMISDFSITSGMMKAQPLLIDTSVNTIDGSGTLDLKDEQLNMKLQVHPKKATLLTLRTPILIHGPLKKPSIGLDPTMLGMRAGAAGVLGVLLTPPGALLAFTDPGLGEKSKCSLYIRQLGNHH